MKVRFYQPQQLHAARSAHLFTTSASVTALSSCSRRALCQYGYVLCGRPHGRSSYAASGICQAGRPGRAAVRKVNHCFTRNTSALVLFHLWNSLSRRLFHTHTPHALPMYRRSPVWCLLCLQLTQSAERGGQHTGCTGYLWLLATHSRARLYTITHNSTYYLYSMQQQQAATLHRADTALGVL
jgi:hypothetical protein